MPLDLYGPSNVSGGGEWKSENRPLTDLILSVVGGSTQLTHILHGTTREDVLVRLRL